MIAKRLLVLAVILAAVLSTAGFLSVSAQSSLSEAHIERIKANCVSAQHSLTQLHANDALLRVNRGQLYEAISVKLMAAMNSRVALNRLDGGNLVKIAADYETELATFRSSYLVYEQKVSKLIKLNCVEQPVEFYDGVAQAREARAVVHGHVLRLHELIRDYETSFNELVARFNARQDKGAN